ncbi:6-phosphogluconolactonase (cycloisomerase 2 family) [Nonomuraea thailandensis]|uniref:6-phosphogluconolactonase (Cycloisomerase 2 family) n=1 Tax=Nonomuraea thailandensis TaxID=1188745 RepID=A0A9X2K407_9ACTN|nr:beta-propeller fold lactonase family protein [Nonomuraea thailandensis]MCP2359588.1 6-phosphogluconolactonase (cycloisomerase 2 family) [Nonomuraea thailandensis]
MKHVRIGGYGPGIVTIGGDLTRVTSPSFLAAHPSLPVLYAVGELERGWLTAYQAQGAELAPLDERPSEGHSPCHVAVDPEGGLLAAANYGDGTATLYRLDERGAFAGEPIVLRHTGSGPDARRQEGPHAHQAVFHDGLLHVSDLGTDEIRRYRHDGTPLEPITLAPGTGPRHFAFAGSRLYVAGELDGTVTLIEGEHRTVVRASRHEGGNAPSHLQLHGDLVYVGNRGPNTISVLLAADLSPVAEVPSGGDWPRHFAIDGERMYVANQYSDTVTSFRLEDGVPVPDGESYEVQSPACVLIM